MSQQESENDTYLRNYGLENAVNKKSKLSELFPNIGLTPRNLYEECRNTRMQLNFAFPNQTSSSKFLKKEFPNSINPDQAYSQSSGNPIFLPPKPPLWSLYSHSQPTATITSNQYKREQEQEHENKQKDQPIKIEPSISDNDMHRGSTSNTGNYSNNDQAKPRPLLSANDQAENQERHIFADVTRMAQRPTVIRNARRLMTREQNKFVKMEVQMLKMHGDLLKKTGSPSYVQSS